MLWLIFIPTARFINNKLSYKTNLSEGIDIGVKKTEQNLNIVLVNLLSKFFT